MKNSLVYGTVMAGQLAVAAIVLQGCKTYTPGSRSAFGGGTEMGTEEVREANVVNVDNTSEVSSEVSAKPIVSTPVVKTQVSSSKVGAPGTYKEFVLEPGAEINDPHAGLTKLHQKHVPQPAPSPIGVGRVPSGPRLSADGKYSIYTVKNGDSAGVIANSHGMTRAEFIKLNNITNADRIRIGQEVKVLADAKPLSGGKAIKTASGSSADAGLYTVVNGDSIGKIASKHHVKRADLMAANGITDANRIRIGQKLRIPGTSVKTAVENTAPVRAEKTDATTAVNVSSNATEVGEAAGINDLISQPTGTEVSKPAGEAVKALPPVVKETATVVPPTPVTATAVPATKDYTVLEGDDVYSVSLKFRVRPMDLRRVNNLTGATLTPGSVIKVPVAE